FVRRDASAKGRNQRRPPGLFSTYREVSMTRLRYVGILYIVLALAGSSILSAQMKPAHQTPKAVTLKPIEINIASDDEFVLIVSDRTAAKKIIQARPYRTKTELVSKQFISREQYDKLKDLLVAKQPPKKK